MKWLFENPAKTVGQKIRNIAASFAILQVYVFALSTFLQWLFNPSGQFFSSPSIYYQLFFTCIVAPLWEELAFRVAPITIAKKFGKEFVLPVIIISSILFGWGHGGPVNVLIQGAMGFVWSWLYIKNNYSYWSVVAAHAIWNSYVSILSLM